MHRFRSMDHVNAPFWQTTLKPQRKHPWLIPRHRASWNQRINKFIVVFLAYPPQKDSVHELREGVKGWNAFVNTKNRPSFASGICSVRQGKLLDP